MIYKPKTFHLRKYDKGLAEFICSGLCAYQQSAQVEKDLAEFKCSGLCAYQNLCVKQALIIIIKVYEL